MHFFAIFMDLMCFYEFYFREKGQIREIRENISTRKLVHLKYMVFKPPSRSQNVELFIILNFYISTDSKAWPFKHGRHLDTGTPSPWEPK